MILYFYEDMDTLAMKERIQNAAIGLQRGGNTLTSRGMIAAMGSFTPLSNYYLTHSFTFPSIEEGEQLMARHLHEDKSTTNAMEGLGATSYSAPIQLIMVWDNEWKERLVYYQACDDEKGLDHCDVIEREKVFVDYKNGDYRLDEKIKDKVPPFFRNIKDKKPTTCDVMGSGCLGIAADITLDEGGPMFFYLADASMMGMMIMMQTGGVNIYQGWHYLAGFNMRLLQQIQANRTGMCVSGFSSVESDLPDFVQEELNTKLERDLVLDPHDYIPGTRTIRQNTDQVTLDQDYYVFTNRKVQKTDREYCDSSYDHSGDVSTSYAYLAYYGYDLSIGNLSKDQVYMVRFDYHDPLTAKLLPRVETFLLCLILIWLICIAGMMVFFNALFLVPLDKMRKVRADFIKTILKGVDDDGVLAQQVFGDMLDDTALIEAKGDEIKVMQTLQYRVDALYSTIIKNRQSDLNRIRFNALRESNALKLMTFFLRRDDDNLRSILPGLLDSNDMARRARRTNISDPTDHAELTSSRHTFRSLKSILSNQIATEFFKAFCVKRGRSSVNSFFFLMDVSWLTQVEGAARNESDDFLSSLLAESIPQSPASMSQLSSPRPGTQDENNGMNHSSELLCTLDQNATEEQPSPHRSHFGKPKDANAEDGPKGRTLSVESVSPLGSPRSYTLGSPRTSALNSPRTSALNSPRASALSSPRGTQRPQFASKNGETIAQFIRERYFGRKSLAQADLKHAALLGCSQIPDYLALRDKNSISYTPFMYNNLVTAVTKKFSTDVIPQFLNSTSFQMMTYALVLSGFFEKIEKADKTHKLLLVVQPEEEQKKETESVNGIGFKNPLIHCLWSACKVTKKEEKADESDDESSSSSSSDSDDDDKEEDKSDE